MTKKIKIAKKKTNFLRILNKLQNNNRKAITEVLIPNLNSQYAEMFILLNHNGIKAKNLKIGQNTAERPLLFILTQQCVPRSKYRNQWKMKKKLLLQWETWAYFSPLLGSRHHFTKNLVGHIFIKLQFNNIIPNNPSTRKTKRRPIITRYYKAILFSHCFSKSINLFAFVPAKCRVF